MTTLLPCPFCGATEDDSRGPRLRQGDPDGNGPGVDCDNCLTFTVHGHDDESAAAHWNRRSHPPIPAPPTQGVDCNAEKHLLIDAAGLLKRSTSNDKRRHAEWRELVDNFLNEIERRYGYL